MVPTPGGEDVGRGQQQGEGREISPESTSKPAASGPGVDPELVARINEAHGRVRECLGAALVHARRAGEFLIQAQVQVPRRFKRWLAENRTISYETAALYMRIARRWEELEWRAKANMQDIADLTLSAAAKLLVNPRPVAEQLEVAGDAGAPATRE